MSGFQRCARLFLLLNLALGFSPSDYTNTLTINSDPLYQVYWKIDEVTRRINIAVEAETANNWVGLGFSTSGSMLGADIVTLEGDALVDRFSFVEDTPSADACQDWTLISSERNNSFTTFEMSRQLDTGDSQDVAIDRSVTRLAMLIAAIGQTRSFSYHGTETRYTATVDLFGTEAVPSSQDFSRVQNPNDFVDLLNDAIPLDRDQGTYYHVVCHAVPAELSGAAFAIAFKALIDSANANSVHHFIVQTYATADCNDDFIMDQIFGWAHGTPDLVLPDGVGFRIGVHGTYQALGIRVETHFNDLPADVTTDHSGIRMFWTTTGISHSAATFLFGDPAVALRGTPVGSGTGFGTHLFECPTQCSEDFLSGPVTVFNVQLHMHRTGRRMEFKQKRSGRVIRTVTRDFYDGNMQTADEPANLEIHPGDGFTLECSYDTTERIADFGLATSDEMCIAFVTFFPAPDSIFFCGLGIPFPDCTVSHTNRGDLQSSALGRTFGVESTCSSNDGGGDGAGGAGATISGLVTLFTAAMAGLIAARWA